MVTVTGEEAAESLPRSAYCPHFPSSTQRDRNKSISREFACNKDEIDFRQEVCWQRFLKYTYTTHY